MMFVNFLSKRQKMYSVHAMNSTNPKLIPCQTPPKLVYYYFQKKGLPTKMYYRGRCKEITQFKVFVKGGSRQSVLLNYML